MIMWGNSREMVHRQTRDRLINIPQVLLELCLLQAPAKSPRGNVDECHAAAASEMHMCVCV